MTEIMDAPGLAEATAALREANLAFARRYPGERAERQPVHTLIEGAQRFHAGVARERGAEALAALDAYASDAATLGRALGIADHPSLDAVVARVREKLAREPVEDYRIDFEAGYGVRSDEAEDREAARVADEIARGVAEGSLPSSIGVRVKPLTEELRGRSVRTLTRLITALVERDALPAGWLVTLPKVTVVAQVEYFVALLGALERSLGIADGALRFEIQVEVPQVILDASGATLLPRLHDAADGRLVGVDFGTYDYTAACGITAAYQRMRHPACELARRVLQVAFAGTGVRLADGSTSVLPVPTRDGDAAGVHAGWRLHHDDVRHSLADGFYQGWDLHPAQLVSRYAAVASFYLESIDVAGARLRAFLDRAAQVTLVGGVLDEPATGQALLGFFLRAIGAGAVTEAEATERTGLSVDELRSRSFATILRGRGIA
jgi:citrate lyase beta subunit